MTNPENCIKICPRCQGEGEHADGVDEAACTTTCERCWGDGCIVDLEKLGIADPFAGFDDDELFFTAHVSLDGRVVGVQHPEDAWWMAVHQAHIVLRDWLNERIAAAGRCPHKPLDEPEESS